jgi:colanic acid biosynthesis glycosyl transferase WcaI
MINESSETGRRPRLWIISELYYPEMTSTGYYITMLAEGLANEFQVNVLSGQPNYSARGTVAPKRETLNGVSIVRAAGTRLSKDVLIFRLVNMLTLGSSVFLHAVRRLRQGDQVLVVTTPPSMPFIAALASVIRGASYTLLIHDNYPDMLVAVKKLKPDSFTGRVIDHMNRWLFKHARRAIVVGRDMQELVVRKAAGLELKVVSIPNWAELESVRPASRKDNPLLHELGIGDDKFVLLYAGNMGYPNDLETIIETASGIDDDVHFIFLGTGVKRRWLEGRVRELDLHNVTILGPRPRSEQTVFLNACDAALVSLVDNMLGVSMPSRTYNILAAGKPIIAIADTRSELALVVKEENVGWVVEPGDKGEFRKAIQRAKGSGNELALMGERARQAAVEKYSFEKALDKYRTALKS